jgi:hemerythrin
VDFYNRLEPGKDTIKLELLLFLRRWLETHILMDDKEGCAFLLKKGLKGSWSKRSWLGKIWDFIYYK